MVGERPVEQSRAVGPGQVLVDQAQVVLQLRAIEQAFKDRVDHRQDAVAHAGRLVARVQQVADARRRDRDRRGPWRRPDGAWLRVEQRVAGEHVVDQQQAQEIAPHRLGLAFEPLRGRLAADLPQRARQRRQGLVVQRHGPGAAHVLAHRRIGRLQRVVPVAVAVGGERGAGDRAAARQRERAQHMLPDRVAPAGTRGALRYERDRLVEDRGVAARDQVLG